MNQESYLLLLMYFVLGTKKSKIHFLVVLNVNESITRKKLLDSCDEAQKNVFGFVIISMIFLGMTSNCHLRSLQVTISAGSKIPGNGHQYCSNFIIIIICFRFKVQSSPMKGGGHQISRNIQISASRLILVKCGQPLARKSVVSCHQ